MILKTININEIKTIDYFDISYPKTLAGFSESIKKQGLLSPLRLIRDKNGKYRLFSGFRRLRSLREIETSEAPAFLYNESDLSEEDAFISSIEENRKGRSLNDFEISSILNILTSHFRYSKKEIVAKFSSLFEISKELGIHEKYRMLSNINPQLKEFIVKKRIPLKTSYCLSKWADKSQKGIATVIENIHLTHGDFSKLITLIDEIAGMEKTSPQEIVNDGFIEKILSDKDLPANRKTVKIIKYLEKKRFPKKSALEDKLNRIEKEFSVAGKIKLKLPYLLEGNKISIEIDNKNRGSFEEAKKLLESEKFQEEIRQLFNE